MADVIVSQLPIVTLAEAREAGLLYYFTGKPCKRGHIAERHVSGRSCLECHHVRSKQWYESNKDVALVQSQGRYLANREVRLAQSKIVNERNREVIEARRFANRAIAAANSKAWRQANPEWFRELRRQRRLRKRNAEGSHTGEEIKQLFAKQRGRCANPACHRSIKDGYHVDHIMPLVLGGSNWISNIQLLCPTCNLKKRAKDPIKWAQENGMLL
jgi:5-methylcytosine-specific restriction endonuclease McrA